jgi:hypothetical protein
MAFTNKEVFDFLKSNPTLSDADIFSAMKTYGVSPEQIATATGVSVKSVIARLAPLIAPNQSVLLGDTYVQSIYDTTGSGQDEQLGALKNIITYKAGENKVGGAYNQYLPSGDLERTGVQQEVNANKDFMNFVLTAATMGGLPAGIGEALGLTGATGQAVGQGLLTTGTKLGGGESLKDSLTAGLLSGGLVYGGSALSDALKTPTTVTTPDTTAITATTPVQTSTPITASDLGIDYSLANGTQMQQLTDMGGAQGLQAGTSANLDTMGGGQGITLNLGPPSTTLADAIKTIGGVGPSNLTDMNGAQGLTYQTPSGVVTSTGTIPIGGLTGNTNVIGETGINTATNIGSTIGSTIPTTVITPLTVPPVVVAPVVTPPVVPPVVPPTIGDVIKTIGTVATVASLANVLNPPTNTSTPTGFDIVPVPEDWKTPPKTGVASFTPLTPIDFGTRNLLKGTQWEELLNPNYGQVPEAVKYSQPSNLSYQDLMSILGSKQGMPSRSSLSINDIISGIQNQYGQAPKGAVG